MPELKRVLPDLAGDSRYRGTDAYRLRNRQVTQVKLTSGAPCASHDALFAPWPGPETNIKEWYVLDNGYAVGKGADADGDDVYPVLKISREPD